MTHGRDSWDCLKQLKDREDELGLLRELGEAIVSELELDKVLRLVVDRARALIDAESMMLPLLDSGRDSYAYAAASGKDAEDIEKSRFSTQVGMCGWVLRHEKPLLYGEFMEWEMDEKTRWEEGRQSALLVPLFGKGHAIIGGLSGLGKTGGGSFTRRDLELLTLFANQVSIAIENAVLFQQVHQMVDTLEQRVAERTAELQAANEELEAFSYSVSHDLRAPLRSIDGFSLALLEDYGDVLDGEGKTYLERLRANAQRMGVLIEAMLQLSRVTRTELHREAVDLSALAGEIVARLRDAAPEHTATIEIEAGMTVLADPHLLQIALENLLTNAWKYSAGTQQPRIEIASSRDERGLVYRVRDNGAGFDMQRADRLFKPFQRLHAEREFEGTGIGLATVQRVIHRHGGRIWAESAPGLGATFYFTLSS